MLGFVPALRFPRSQVQCRLYKSPSDETINRGTPCTHAHTHTRTQTHTERSHTYVNDPVVHDRFGGLCGNTKITQHALKLKVKASRIRVLVKNAEVGHYTEEEGGVSCG